LEEVDDLNQENTSLHLRLDGNQNMFEKEKIQLEGYIKSLKDDFELNQVSHVREKDRNSFIIGDFEKEISSLKAENGTLRSLSA
jgi:hypothetical protein